MATREERHLWARANEAIATAIGQMSVADLLALRTIARSSGSELAKRRAFFALDEKRSLTVDSVFIAENAELIDWDDALEVARRRENPGQPQ